MNRTNLSLSYSTVFGITINGNVAPSVTAESMLAEWLATPGPKTLTLERLGGAPVVLKLVEDLQDNVVNAESFHAAMARSNARAEEMRVRMDADRRA